MRKHGLSDQVRAVAKDRYVDPALKSGQHIFSIKVRSVLDELAPLGFPANSTPLVCDALQSKRFLGDNGLEILEVEGPPSKKSTTVVVRYRVADQARAVSKKNMLTGQGHLGYEEPSARARRLSEALRGLLKEEMREHGGSESFMRWIRSDDEKEKA
jgi:hypothetical protein